MQDSNLIINPMLSVRTYEVNKEVLNFQLAAPKKGSSIIIDSYYPKKNGQLFFKLKEILLGGKPYIKNSFSEVEQAQLVKNNVLIESELASKHFKFDCHLSEEKWQLTPVGMSNDLMVNPNIFISPKNCPPTEVHLRGQNLRVDWALASDEILWVKEPITEAWWPYSLSKKVKSFVVELIKFKSVDIKLPPDIKQMLTTVSVLIPKDHKIKAKLTVESYQKIYREQGSLHLFGLLNPFQVSAFKKYLIELEQQGLMRFGDGQSYKRYWAHNDVMCRYVQSQLYQFISLVVDEKWVPAFSYYVAYKDGSSLKKHVDREQASLSLTLLVDYGNESGSQLDSWPIYTEERVGSDTYHKYLVGVGNGVIFDGNKYVHYRLKIPKGHYSMSMLFHFVKSNYKGKVL